MLQLDSSSVRCQGWSEDSRSQERVNNPHRAPLRARAIAAHRRQLRAMSGPRQLGLVTTSPGRHPPGRPPWKLLFHLFFSTNCWVDVPRVTFKRCGKSYIFCKSPSERGLEGAWRSSITELFIWTWRSGGDQFWCADFAAIAPGKSWACDYVIMPGLSKRCDGVMPHKM